VNNNFKGILFYGFGGHARSIADVALSNSIKEILFVDVNARSGETFCGYPVVRDLPESLPEGWIAFPASGSGEMRKEQLEEINRRGWITGNIVSPTATIGVGANFGTACFVGHHSHVGPNAKVGDACIINTGAIIEHDCVIDDFTHISINTAIAGKTRIGSHCFIGAGSVVIDGIKVTDKVTLGANGCIVKDIDESGVYVGTPARIIKN